MDLRDALDTAYDHSQRIFDGVADDQLGDPTPCTQWDVRALTDHVVSILDAITTGIGGDSAASGEASSPGEAFRDATDRSRRAWRALESLDRQVTLPWGESSAEATARLQVADVLVHTWDLAAATGQERTLPEEPAGVALEFTKGMLRPEFRSEAPDARFGPEVPVADDAPVTDRLVGWLGRDPRRP